MHNNDDMCPICGHDGIIEKMITEKFEYKGHVKKIEDYTIYECTECNESIVDTETLKKAEKIIRDFHREVDGLLTSKEIKNIRSVLGFTQKDFGLILGGGEKGFARYESCAVTQSKAMDNLIRIVFEKPEVIDIILKNGCESNGNDEYIEPFIYQYDNDEQPLKIVGE